MIGTSKIVIVRKTVPGVWGIHKLAALVKDNFVINPGDELSVVFATHNYKRLKVVTVDATGAELRIRMLNNGLFRTFVLNDDEDDEKNDALTPLPLSADKLKRLLFDGTVNGIYQFPLSEAHLTHYK